MTTFAVPSGFNSNTSLNFGTNQIMSGIGVAGNEGKDNGNSDIIQVIKNAINRVLSIL
jgi:hypothetical protein